MLCTFLFSQCEFVGRFFSLSLFSLFVPVISMRMSYMFFFDELVLVAHVNICPWLTTHPYPWMEAGTNTYHRFSVSIKFRWICFLFSIPFFMHLMKNLVASNCGFCLDLLPIQIVSHLFFICSRIQKIRNK